MDCAVSAYANNLLIAGRANSALLAGTGNSDTRHTDKLLSAGSAAITAFLTVKVVINISPILCKEKSPRLIAVGGIFTVKRGLVYCSLAAL